jgi:hypothetical protein
MRSARPRGGWELGFASSQSLPRDRARRFRTRFYCESRVRVAYLATCILHTRIDRDMYGGSLKRYSFPQVTINLVTVSILVKHSFVQCDTN